MQQFLPINGEHKQEREKKEKIYKEQTTENIPKSCQFLAHKLQH